jgi:hypothetical protein
MSQLGSRTEVGGNNATSALPATADIRCRLTLRFGLVSDRYSDQNKSGQAGFFTGVGVHGPRGSSRITYGRRLRRWSRSVRHWPVSAGLRDFVWVAALPAWRARR